MRQPPYHTGKVAIGCAWQPMQRPYHDRDACRLQEALLASRQPRRKAGSGFVLAAALALLAAVIGLMAA